jgi:phosphatidylserine/phosphatidylglycerophosphate/cardiolipin synthase-like enzyme
MWHPRRAMSVYRRRVRVSLVCLATLFALAQPRPAQALERLCDSSFENCRTEILLRIQAENIGIDVGAWFFEDARFSNELIKRRQAGVPVRVIGDPDAARQHPLNSTILDQMAAAGIAIRYKASSGIEHWKMMLFAGQNVVYFGSANFSDDAFVPNDPYRDFVDETIYLTDDPDVVNSFKTKFDNTWMDTGNYANYANAPNSSLTRRYPTYSIDPELNWAPASGTASYRSRAVAAYTAETQRIDVIMYRITDQAHVDALLNVFRAGVPVRIYTEQAMYRDLTQPWHSYSIDRLYRAGIPIRDRAHLGQNHEKLVLLYGQRMTIFGSSNMTSKSSDSQHEHNYFTRKPEIFNFFVSQFARKWNNTNALRAAETKAFTPLPPDAPLYKSPADGASVATTGVRLTWYGGPWAHLYDVYFGTSPTPPLYAANKALGPSLTTSTNQSFTLPTLLPGVTYYWKIVSKTMAQVGKSGPVRSFTAGGTIASAPPPSAGTIVLWTADIPSTRIHGDWALGPDTGAGGKSMWNPDRGRAKIAPALGAPANYFEATFNANAGTAYHLWVRMRAQTNSLANDSVHAQFNHSVNSSGTPMMRIGTTSSAELVLQAGSGGAAPVGWGWTDNGWGSLGASIYFDVSGTQTVRIQQREDGAIIDQIVLSPDVYMTIAPGSRTGDATILPRNP